MPLSMRMNVFQNWGSQSLAYSAATQQGLQYFGNSKGFIAYQEKYGFRFALGDPVSGPSQIVPLIDAFLDKFPRTTFCQIDESTASLLDYRKYWINEMGVDTRLELAEYDFKGKDKERFRYATNWLFSRGYQIIEAEFTLELVKQTKSLVNQWRKSRTVKCEMAFLNRPMRYLNQPGMRRFFLFDASNQLNAFVFFDPVMANRKIVGYVTSFKRRAPFAPSLAETGVCKFAIDQFRQEGRQTVWLGISPFANIEKSKFRDNWILRTALKYYFSAGWVNRFIYNLQGHASFKNRFRGKQIKTYFASPSYINDLRLFALLRLCKVY